MLLKLIEYLAQGSMFQLGPKVQIFLALVFNYHKPDHDEESGLKKLLSDLFQYICIQLATIIE